MLSDDPLRKEKLKLAEGFLSKSDPIASFLTMVEALLGTDRPALKPFAISNRIRLKEK